MKKVLIIGGGLAGLSAAAFLAKENFRITLIEASPSLGGRAKSFHSKKIGRLVDNGQHLLMGCYTHTLKFLETINATKNFERHGKLSIPFIERGGKESYLNVRSPFYPLNLLSAILRFNAIPFRQRVKALIPFLALLSLDETFTPNLSKWLFNLRQDEKIQKALWETIAIGALNVPLNLADAKIFKNVLKEIFLNGNKGFEFILAKENLTEDYVLPAKEFLISQGVEILLSEKAIATRVKEGKIAKVLTNKGEFADFDFVISALPFEQTKEVFPLDFPQELNESFQHSPIINLHLKLKHNPFHTKFAALIDSEIHWLFNHEDYISLVTSAAEKLIPKTKEEIIELFTTELEEFFPLFYKELIEDAELVKEKKATFVPSAQFEKARKKLERKIGNLFLAGDWTYIGLPATIEGAVASGFEAARSVLKNS